MITRCEKDLHIYDSGIYKQCPYCIHDDISDFIVPFEIPQSPPLIIGHGMCSRSVQNLNKLSDHYNSIFGNILKENNALNSLKKLFYLCNETKHYDREIHNFPEKLKSYITDNLATNEEVLRYLGKMAVKKCGDMSKLANEILYESIQIVANPNCPNCNNSLNECAKNIKHLCKKCLSVIDEKHFINTTWYKCPCNGMVCVSDNGRLCNCGKAYNYNELEKIKVEHINRELEIRLRLSGASETRISDLLTGIQL